MLTKKQIEEIKSHLVRAQNPVFFFDNDADGLCSFLLLQRSLGRGKGIAVKSFPALDITYFRRVLELNSDYVFILDKPLVSNDFFEEIHKINVPVVWIDHHEIDKNEIPTYVNYYNPLYNKYKSNNPVTMLCYDLIDKGRKNEDLWIAIVGCIADSILPDFYSDFLTKYPDLGIKTKSAFDVLYKSGIGQVAKVLGNGLKDKTSNVILMLKFLMKVKSPYEVLEETNTNYSMHKRSNEINLKYEKLLTKAKEFGKGNSKFLFFKYSGDLSISSELSNELQYLFPEKYVVVVYVNGLKANLSLRGKNIREKFEKVIKGVEGARGGGHCDAVGGQMPIESLEEFKEKLEEEILGKK